MIHIQYSHINSNKSYHYSNDCIHTFLSFQSLIHQMIEHKLMKSGKDNKDLLHNVYHIH